MILVLVLLACAGVLALHGDGRGGGLEVGVGEGRGGGGVVLAPLWRQSVVSLLRGHWVQLALLSGRRGGQGHWLCRDLTQGAGGVLEGSLLSVHVLLEQHEMFPENVPHKDGSPAAELLLVKAAHFLTSHLKQTPSKPGIEL